MTSLPKKPSCLAARSMSLLLASIFVIAVPPVPAQTDGPAGTEATTDA